MTLSLLLGALASCTAEPVHGGISDQRESLVPATVNANIIYPADGPARAVAIVAHCTMCWGDWYPHLADLATSHGLMLVFLHTSPTDSFLHWLNWSNGASHTWFTGYAKDMSEALHRIREQAASDPDSELHGKLAHGAPALAVGHSLGGASGLIAAGQDAGFKAAFVLSPCMVHSEDLAAITQPLFILSATFDGICPPRMVGRQYFDALVRSRAVFYAELVGGTHCGFMDVAGTKWAMGKSLGVPGLANGACSATERVLGAIFGEPLTQDYWLDHTEQLALTARYIGLFVEAALLCETTYESLAEALRLDGDAGVLANVQAALAPRAESLPDHRPPSEPFREPIRSQQYMALVTESLCT
jgi:pimeloyl-ACP methyl ester carboxylesterase